jgi:hypothetical protein
MRAASRHPMYRCNVVSMCDIQTNVMNIRAVNKMNKLLKIVWLYINITLLNTIHTEYMSAAHIASLIYEDAIVCLENIDIADVCMKI